MTPTYICGVEDGSPGMRETKINNKGEKRRTTTIGTPRETKQRKGIGIIWKHLLGKNKIRELILEENPTQ